MLRPALLVIPLALAFAADPAREASSVITELAASLTAGNLELFLEPFDRGMPNYATLSANVAALMRQGQTQSYIEVVKNEGDDKTRTIEADWELRIQRDTDATASTGRESHIFVRMEKQGKRWRIMAFSPVGFLEP